ncbi:unnamed protein product [Caenorhabditis sp. 36 PRJEB53466]|nr:unnamed protein product [Caenorhabditis sp. 36 PRJEB53466]
MCSMELSKWIDYARDCLRDQMDRKIKIVGVIGKDLPDHGKADNINTFMKENAFPMTVDEDETCTISAYYHENERILFLVMNGADDIVNVRKQLRQTDEYEDDNEPGEGDEGAGTSENTEIAEKPKKLKEKEPPKNYFDVMEESEVQEMRMLHFLFVTCHVIIVFEETSRLCMPFMQKLKKVNVTRMLLRRKVNEKLISAGLKKTLSMNRKLSKAEAEGRVTIPRLLMAFHKNNIRFDLKGAKKREIYEKLERSLDEQLNKCLRQFNLSDNGASSLYVVKRDIVNEMFEVFMDMALKEKKPGKEGEMGEREDDDILDPLPNNGSLMKFFDNNFRAEEKLITLENVVDLLDCMQCLLDGSLETKQNKQISVNPILEFQKQQTRYHIEEAFKIYSVDNYRPGQNALIRGGFHNQQEHSRHQNQPSQRSRDTNQHFEKLEQAILYIRAIVFYQQDEAEQEIRKRCTDVWLSELKSCDAYSMMGRKCVLKPHPEIGDMNIPDCAWSPHDAANTLLSTCVCGHTQLIRPEPFSVIEANYLFFASPEFTCCRNKWSYKFRLYKEVIDGKEVKMEEEGSVWAGGEDSSLNDGIIIKKEDDYDDYPDRETKGRPSGSMSEEDSDYVRERPVASTSNGRSSNRRRPHSGLDLAFFHAKQQARLMEDRKLHDFIFHVPTMLTRGKLPLFPSWYLTLLGDASIYHHHVGLRDQPNFKIGGEYLTPAVITLDVDINSWNRDLNKIRSEDYQRSYGGFREARVKLFVGFEYECTRGHRFFVDHTGEPIIYNKGAKIAKESAQRSALGDVLEADLPIRRPCTCRKQPSKAAQLMKVHIVTPKAPIRATINPHILIPGVTGIFVTGEPPLELQHSKYYILHLPTIYSNSNDVWKPDECSPDMLGIWKGGALKIAYIPSNTIRW